MKKFHVWTMDWTKDSIVLGLDGAVMNAASLAKTVNNDGTNPFQDRSQYLLLNLAMGGNGGDPSKAKFPMKYEVDYVRVYQPGSSAISQGRRLGQLEIHGLSGLPGKFQVTQKVDQVARLEVRNAAGRRIVDREFLGTAQIDLGGEASGVYFARLRTRIGEEYAKILR